MLSNSIWHPMTGHPEKQPAHADCPGKFYESSSLMRRVQKQQFLQNHVKLTELILYLQSFWEGIELMEDFRHAYTKLQIQASA